MGYTDHGNLPVGTPVHVEFDGEVYDQGEYAKYPASPNEIVVSDGGFIHRIHRRSPKVTVREVPRPDVELGQVWRADNRNFVVYSPGNGLEWLFIGPPTEIKGSGEFFKAYPAAKLLLDADGITPDEY